MIVDTDQLFQKNSIEQLQGILVKIKADADKKKSDLRRMVGESYRDVIDAADAIGNMNVKAEALLNNFGETKELLEISPVSSQKQNANSSRKGRAKLIKVNLYKMAAMIRILTITPEQIWHSLEFQNHLNASRMFLYAKGVYNSLMSEENEDVSALIPQFPLIKNQWESVQSLEKQIISKATVTIKDVLSNEKALLSAICAIGVLNNGSLLTLLHNFLDQRRRRALDVLLVQESVAVQQSIALMVEILVSTATSAIKLFSTTAINDNLSSIVGAAGATATLFSKIYTENSNVGVLYSYLPDSVKQIAPKLHSHTPIPPTEVLKLANTWIAGLKSSIHQRLITIFASVNTGIELVSIQKHIASIPIEFDKNTIGEITCISSQSALWQEFIEDSYLNRCDGLIKECFGGFFKNVEEEMKTHLQGDSAEIKGPLDHQVANFIWNQKIDGSKPVNLEVLIATPPLREFATLLDSLCAKVMESLKPLLANSEGSTKSYSQILSKFIQMDFISLLQDHCRSVTKLLNTIESSKSNPFSALQSVYLGRMAIVLKDKLQSMYKNLCPKDNLTEIISRVSSEIQAVYMLSHKSWISNTCVSIFKVFIDSFANIDWDNCNQFLGIWEGMIHLRVDLEDKTGTLPTVCSPPVATLLFSCCNSINEIEGFMLDQILISQFLDTAFHQACSAFRSFLGSNTVISQNGYIQILFDLEYLSECLSKWTLAESDAPKGQQLYFEVANSIKSRISKQVLSTLVDPHLQNNVQKAYFRSSILYGPILTLNPPVPKKTIPSSAKHQILALAPNVPRFTLLPVAVPVVGIPSRNSTVGNAMGRLSKPKATLNLKPSRRNPSEVPLGLSSDHAPSPKKGFMGAVAGLSNIAQPPKATAEFIDSASSFFSGLYSAAQQTGANTPKERKKI